MTFITPAEISAIVNIGLPTVLAIYLVRWVTVEVVNQMEKDRKSITDQMEKDRTANADNIKTLVDCLQKHDAQAKDIAESVSEIKVNLAARPCMKDRN